MGEERIHADGQASFLVRRGAAPSADLHNRLGYEIGDETVVKVGDVVQADRERVIDRHPAVRRHYQKIFDALERNQRRRTVRPVPKPAPSKPKRSPAPRPTDPVPCPACNGELPSCEVCDGEGWVSAPAAEAWLADG